MSIDISIIVPIYNLEDYLSTCVDSILGQTFTNFELILVNDGSTDGSGEICDSYAALDSRVKAIHKANGGTASSRNAGLKVARGDYIGFVDNDDYINHHMFEILYENAIKHSSDIVVCDFLKVEEDNVIKEYDPNYKVKQLNKYDALNEIYDNDFPTFIYPWNKIYKRHLFQNVKYEHGNLYDDETVAHNLLYKCKNVTYVQLPLYYYVQRKSSMVNSPFHIKKFDRVYALKGREVFFRKKNEFHLHQRSLKHYMDIFFWYYYTAKTILIDVEKELKQLKKETFNNTLLQLLKHNEIGWKQKGMCTLFWIHPSIFEFVRDGAYKRKRKQHTET